MEILAWLSLGVSMLLAVVCIALYVDLRGERKARLLMEAALGAHLTAHDTLIGGHAARLGAHDVALAQHDQVIASLRASHYPIGLPPPYRPTDEEQANARAASARTSERKAPIVEVKSAPPPPLEEDGDEVTAVITTPSPAIARGPHVRALDDEHTQPSMNVQSLLPAKDAPRQGSAQPSRIGVVGLPPDVLPPEVIARVDKLAAQYGTTREAILASVLASGTDVCEQAANPGKPPPSGERLSAIEEEPSTLSPLPPPPSDPLEARYEAMCAAAGVAHCRGVRCVDAGPGCTCTCHGCITCAALRRQAEHEIKA